MNKTSNLSMVRNYEILSEHSIRLQFTYHYYQWIIWLFRYKLADLDLLRVSESLKKLKKQTNQDIDSLFWHDILMLNILYLILTQDWKWQLRRQVNVIKKKL